MAVTTDKSVDIYLASIWKYEEAGVERILSDLRDQNPQGKFEFERGNEWFKATCPANRVVAVQKAFSKIHADIESELQKGDKITLDSKWIRPPSPRDLSDEPAERSAEYQCPAKFDRYNNTLVWKRVKEETPDGITVHTIVSRQDMAAIAEASGIFIQCDTTNRLAYLGGPSRQSLLQANTMLDNMFRRYIYTLPLPKHLLHAETDGMHHVDVRYMAHVNEGMLTSTILDPGQYPGERLPAMFKAMFAKAVCLRICLIDHFKRIEVSYFGPKEKPLFRGQAHKYPMWFKGDYYASTMVGVQNKKGTFESATPSVADENYDLLSLDTDAFEMPSEPPELPATKPSKPAPLPPASGKYSCELRQLWECNNPSSTEAKAAEGHSDPSKVETLITTLDDDTTLIDITPDTPPKATTQVQPKEPLMDLTEQNESTSLVKHKAQPAHRVSLLLTKRVCNQTRLLLADLPYRRGRIRMQAELGRIYMLDANPTGLATNKPGEAAAGWTPVDILNRLDTVCVAPGSVMFTKALTVFANDMETVLGTDAAGSPWTLQEKRVLYEFKCQRFSVESDGAVLPHSPFVVEIDGTTAGAFAYSMRRLGDARPPIWVHCIRRHWDARVTVLYSDTVRLDKMYGDFARGLVESLVVPPGPIGVGVGPRFEVAFDHRVQATEAVLGAKVCTKVLSARVRHVGRHVSADGSSWLDVSWNRHMRLEERARPEEPQVGVLRATTAVDDPDRGVFSGWYEASVVSARAEAAFRENETLEVGGAASSWTGLAAQEAMVQAMLVPALELVERMDGVGVLMDNGQGERWVPPVRKGQSMALVPTAARRFW